MFENSSSSASRSGGSYHCPFFGCNATPLKAAKHVSILAAAAAQSGSAVLIPMPPPAPLIPSRRDRYTPAKPVM